MDRLERIIEKTLIVTTASGAVVGAGLGVYAIYDSTPEPSVPLDYLLQSFRYAYAFGVGALLGGGTGFFLPQIPIFILYSLLGKIDYKNIHQIPKP